MPQRKISMKASNPKTVTPTASSDLKEELLKWICERHATNGPLDRELLRDKALELASSLGITGFKCSEAWLTLFLKKHGFSPTLTNCNGPTFSDYRVWVDLLRSLITQYRHKDLFNVDELVMYSDFLPTKISSPGFQLNNHYGDGLGESPKTSSGPSSETNRIGMLICCNSSGTEKLQPLISGPYEFENSRKDCHYHQDAASCIPDDLFGEWLTKLNEEMSKTDRKILLLLSRDRIRALQSAPELSHVNLLFFPKDFPTQLRPLRGDVFHCVKMMYRKRYVEHIRSSKKQWGAEEIVDSIMRALKDVSQELIVSSFQRTKFREDESFLKIECPAWDNLRTGISFRRFVTFDDDLSDSSDQIPEDLRFLSANRHQYNLRRSRRDTVDLEVIEEINSINALKGRQAQKRNSDQEIFRPDYQDQSSSGLNKKRKIAEVEEHLQDSQNSNSESSNEETGEQSLIERIEDFLENVIDPTAEENDLSVNDSNHENVNNLINDICQRSDNTRSLMERCLRTITVGNCVGTLNDEDIADDTRSPRRDSIEEVDLRRDETQQRDASSVKLHELVENFPGDAGPSGEIVYVGAETLRDKNLPEVREFDDEKEIPVAGQLELKLGQQNTEAGQAGDNNDIVENLAVNSKTTKRTRDCSDDDDEPVEKRARPDESWSKKYETNFVFGPDLNETSSQSVESSVVDQPLQNSEPVTKSKKTQTRSSELEKRCIFTLDGNTPGVSFPTTKD